MAAAQPGMDEHPWTTQLTRFRQSVITIRTYSKDLICYVDFDNGQVFLRNPKTDI
jgi:hypothetical protein